MRADFYDRPLLYPDFGELVRSRMETVLPLTAEGLERAIERPAERVGVTFEAGLVSTIVSEVNYQPGALPLLQYALTELFDRRQGRVLTHEVYEEIGGIVGALARRADEIYEGWDTESQEAAHQMFMRLVTLGEGVEDTRRRVLRSELMAIAADADTMDDIIDTYAAYRLLSLDHDPVTRSPTVEVAHEAILREWKRLRGWLNDSRHEIRLQRLLATAASEWFHAERDDSFLLRGSRLEQFQTWAADTTLALSPKERDYLDASLTERERQTIAEQKRQIREVRLERRSRNFLRGLVAVLLLATLGALGLTGLAVNQSQIARQNAAESQNVALVSGSQAALANGNTDQAIALAMQAVTLDPNSARSQAALSEAAYAPGTIRTFVGHTDYVDGLALSPDGRMAISASWDKTVILWDIQTGKTIRRFEGHTDKATSVAFAPDGLSAISGSTDMTMIQWNVKTGGVIRKFEGQPDLIYTVAISPDGLYAASGGSKGNIILWNIKTGEMIRRFEGHTDGIQKLQFSADGLNLLSAANDKAVILWAVGTGQILHRFEGHQSNAYSAVFSPDKNMILSGSDDGMMILWDIKTGQIIRRFYELGGAYVGDVAFSPDGHIILSGGLSGLTLWNIETAQPISRLHGHNGAVTAIVFTPDGRMALSASEDHTLRLWDLEYGQKIRHFNSEGAGVWTSALAASRDGLMAMAAFRADLHTNIIMWDTNTGEEIRRYSIDKYISDIAISPDGQTAILATDQGTMPSDVILLAVKSGEEIRRFTGHPSAISSVAFSPDGRTAASAGHNGVMILWDVATGKEVRRFKGYDGDDPDGANVWHYVGFSPDGKSLIATHFNGMIVLWDAATGKEIRHYAGHSMDSLNFVFSGDGRWAFSGAGDNTAILWDVPSGSVVHLFRDHSAAIPRVDITSDGRFGIAGSADNTTTLWDLKTDAVIRRYHAGLITPIFAPDNRTALVGIFGNDIELWRMDLTLNALLTWIHTNRYIPELTCDQRALYRLEPLCTEDATPLPTKPE
jgi:WD40 repeat protein